MKNYIYILIFLFGCNTNPPPRSDFEKMVDKLEMIEYLYTSEDHFRASWHLNPDSLMLAFTDAYNLNQDSAISMFHYYDSLYSIAFTAYIHSKARDRKPEAPYKGQPMESEAYVMATYAVKQNLKAPSTAKFPRGKDYTYSFIEPNQHKITSYVDSQNSFSAMIRTKYTAILEFNGGDWAEGSNWKIISLEFF